MLTIALIINPLAGIGGTVALKGSDGLARQRRAVERHGVARGPGRAGQFLLKLLSLQPNHAVRLRWLCPGGAMGADALKSVGLDPTRLNQPQSPSTGADTREAVRRAQAAEADLIVFVGGDGTARDVLASLTAPIPVLGVPSGVKMHSGVFAVTPHGAAELVATLVDGGLVSVQPREVRDYDDSAGASIRTKYYGELTVPESARFMQHTKVGGSESEPLAVAEIVADIVERWGESCLLIGPGSTCMAVKRALGLPAERATLLGFDLVADGEWQCDLGAQDIADSIATGCAPHVVLSFTRGQGFLLGRGNQQLTPQILRSLDWPNGATVIGSRTKLLSLDGRPLLIDTNDAALDAEYSGLVQITTGYDDRVLYRVAAESDG